MFTMSDSNVILKSSHVAVVVCEWEGYGKWSYTTIR